MENSAGSATYSPAEEKLNVITHAVGLVLSVVAFVLLVVWASMYGNVRHIVSFAVFGVSLVVLYAASTFYHNAKTKKLREKLNIVDHAAIYVLIAGTYTPFTIVTLEGALGWTIFGATWGFAFIGIVLKLFFTGKYDRLSTAMYVFMGWMIVFAVKPLVANLPAGGFTWLLAGGIAYTVGAIFYSIEKIKFNHAIFHVFVLAGSFCHFTSIFWYVLPR